MSLLNWLALIDKRKRRENTLNLLEKNIGFEKMVIYVSRSEDFFFFQLSLFLVIWDKRWNLGMKM